MSGMYCDRLMVGADKGMAFYERVSNVLGWIPGVSSVSGAVRMTVGKIEMVAAGFLGAYVFFATGDVDKGVNTGLKYVSHGAANVGRGFVELFPFIGNLFTFLYDNAEDGRDNRMKYDFEDLKIYTGRCLARLS